MERLLEKDYIHGGTQKDYYQKEEVELCSCPLCNESNFNLIDTDRGLGVVKCINCDLIYTNPRVKNAEENYFGDASIFFEEARLIFSGKKKHHRDRNYNYELKKIQNFKKTGKLLDIGTNMGFFLNKAKKMGFEVEGIEPSPALSKIARDNWNLKIHTAFLENANLKPNSFDIITLIDVFEHVTNPRDLLKSGRELLKDDGIMAIKVPNGDYNHFKMKLGELSGKGKNMDIWDCCEHVVHYSHKTFKKMALEEGFKIKKFFIPLPIHSPVWAQQTGHYFQYSSPFVMDWKRILLRNTFYRLGKLETLFGKKTRFGPDLMFIIEKTRN